MTVRGQTSHAHRHTGHRLAWEDGRTSERLRISGTNSGAERQKHQQRAADEVSRPHVFCSTNRSGVRRRTNDRSSRMPNGNSENPWAGGVQNLEVKVW